MPKNGCIIIKSPLRAVVNRLGDFRLKFGQKKARTGQTKELVDKINQSNFGKFLLNSVFRDC